LRRFGGRPIFPSADPVRIGPGAAIWKSVAGYPAMADFSPSRGRQDSLSGFPWDFERLSHVAVNFQSLFVRAGHVSRFCSPNEQ
jgi:hypothetical protein